MPDNITADIIKIAVLSNYRYKKQMITADEVGFALGNTDISVYDDGWLTEIEIKTAKGDLWQGEKRKEEKHRIYSNPTPEDIKKYIIPNEFFVCVPTELLEEAKKWVLTVNERYGILEYRCSKAIGYWTPRPEDMIYVAKRAKNLHAELYPLALKKIAKRLSSVNITLKEHIQTLKQANKELHDVSRKNIPTN
jgi:hypothetical protein